MANKAISTLAVGSSVYLNVGGVKKEFLVVHQGLPSSLYDSSCDGTWLLMKDIYENRQWDSSDYNAYEASTVNTYLNGPFFSRFDSSIQGIIKQVKIPYRKDGGAGGPDQSGANGLPAKIFLLSAYEVGFMNHYSSDYPVEGAKLDYFESGNGTSATNKRIANLNGSTADWWLRSPRIEYKDYVLRIYSDGQLGNGVVSYPYGIRPALVLPSTTLVDDSGNVVIPDLTAHKTLVNGTVYTVHGGKCMVDGTVYNILKGRTLIGGTGYDITFEETIGKTWVINERLYSSAFNDSYLFNASFVSNGQTFSGFFAKWVSPDYQLGYFTDVNQSAYNQVYTMDMAGTRSWLMGEAYRTITFSEPPTGDLLTWLQANAVQQ